MLHICYIQNNQRSKVADSEPTTKTSRVDYTSACRALEPWQEQRTLQWMMEPLDLRPETQTLSLLGAVLSLLAPDIV